MKKINIGIISIIIGMSLGYLFAQLDKKEVLNTIGVKQVERHKGGEITEQDKEIKDEKIIQNTTQEKQSLSEVEITASNEKPEALLKNEDVLFIKGLGSGEYITVSVKGTIEKVQLVSLAWDANKSDVYQEEVIKDIGTLTNKKLVIETYRSCGIPSERLVWQNTKGEKDSYTMQEDGKGTSQMNSND